MKKIKYEIMLSIVTILTVLITAIGVTFAYFTTSMTGTDGEISATTATIGTFNFDGGNDFTTTSTDIEPGWSSSKTFSIEAAPSNVAQTVYIKMDYTNGFQDLKLRVDGTNGEGDNVNGARGEITLQKTTGENKVTSDLVQIVFPASTQTVKYNYTLTAEFPETNKNQNYDQGKVFKATLYASLGSTEDGQVYFTHSAPNGTTTKPN